MVLNHHMVPTFSVGRALVCSDHSISALVALRPSAVSLASAKFIHISPIREDPGL